MISLAIGLTINPLAEMAAVDSTSVNKALYTAQI
jgi:hypothetical protein